MSGQLPRIPAPGNQERQQPPAATDLGQGGPAGPAAAGGSAERAEAGGRRALAADSQKPSPLFWWLVWAAAAMLLSSAIQYGKVVRAIAKGGPPPLPRLPACWSRPARPTGLSHGGRTFFKMFRALCCRNIRPGTAARCSWAPPCPPRRWCCPLARREEGGARAAGPCLRVAEPELELELAGQDLRPPALNRAGPLCAHAAGQHHVRSQRRLPRRVLGGRQPPRLRRAGHPARQAGERGSPGAAAWACWERPASVGKRGMPRVRKARRTGTCATRQPCGLQTL